MSLLDALGLSAIRRLKVDQMRALYFGLTGRDIASPSTKDALIDEIESLLRTKAHSAAEVSRCAASARDGDMTRNADMRRAWRAENDRARDANNAIFAGLPWPPLAGEAGAHDARVRSLIGGAS